MAVPLTADQLVSALTAEGVTVREVPGWRTNNRNSVGPWGGVNGVMLHHTVTGPGADVVGLIFNGHSELPGPLATGCITKDGTVHLTGNGRANHAGGGDPDVLAAVRAENYGDTPPPTNEHQGSANAVDGNTHFYGWECENKGDGIDSWPRAQYVAMVKATAGICRAHGWSAKSAIGHLEWSDWKPDPRGIDMRDFRRDLAACLALPAGQWNVQQEETMALSAADKTWIENALKRVVPEAVLTTDGIIDNPNPATRDSNAYITLESAVRNIEIVARRIDTTVAAQSAAINKLAQLVGSEVDTAAVVAAVEQAIANAVIHVDVDVDTTPQEA